MITVTAATGQLGSHVIDELLARGVPADQIVAAVRNPEKAAGLAGKGVQVRYADYSKPESILEALAETERLLLISSSEVGQRVDQHRNVIDAAVKVGVQLIAYTSILNAETTGIALADEHKATEAAILKSGLPHVFLRNGWYVENYTANLASALEHGVLIGSAGEGRISAATRADFAAAAAAVLAGDGHESKSYELGGDASFSMSELAAEVASQIERPVAYQNLPADDYRSALVGFGVPEPMAHILSDSDLGISRGELFTTSDDLRRLAGRPTTPLAEAVAAALR